MRTANFVFISACLGMLLFGIGLITLGSVASGLQEKFQLDATSSGTLFSILPIGILTGTLLFGPFCDRYGYKIFLFLSSLCLFIGFQGIAYASSLPLLQGCIYIFGFGGGAINGASNAAVSDISEKNKGANLSLLGVFFAIGALGMPFVLGILEKQFSFEVMVSSVGYLSLLAAGFFIVTKFPAPKQTAGVPFLKGLRLLRDKLLLLIGFFLFCQSGFEGIINNWTTTYLLHEQSASTSQALYALSLYVGGMGVMRLMIGSFLRHISPHTILMISFALLVTGCSLLVVSPSYSLAVGGLILTGAGLAAGFPVMLGFVGDRYAALSGTSFSLVISIALLGNMIVNFLMGIIAEKFGIQHLVTVAFMLTLAMILLFLSIWKRIRPYTL